MSVRKSIDASYPLCVHSFDPKQLVSMAIASQTDQIDRRPCGVYGCNLLGAPVSTDTRQRITRV